MASLLAERQSDLDAATARLDGAPTAASNGMPAMTAFCISSKLARPTAHRLILALSTALYRPAEQSYWANVVPDRERAQVFAASSALTALVTLPAGPLAGALYELSPRGPFLLAIVLQLVALALISTLRTTKEPKVPHVPCGRWTPGCGARAIAF